MNNIRKAACVIRDLSEVDGETIGYMHAYNIAQKLADAELLMPDLPASHSVEGDLSRVSRVEVIAVGEADARKFITYDASHVRIDVQDCGQTLKIFYNQENSNEQR